MQGNNKENIKKLLKLIIMKTFETLTIEVLSNEELSAVKGGVNPVTPVIIME